MNRRRMLQAGAGFLTTGLAGCTGSDSAGESGTEARGSTERTSATATASGGEAPEGVYVQSFREDMYVVGAGGGRGGSETGTANGTSRKTDGANTTAGTSGATVSAGTPSPSETASTNSADGVGTAAMPVAGDYRFGLMYAAPHVFWTVNGDERSKATIEEGDSLHLMSVVWDPETRTVLPDTGLSVEISRDGELVSEEVIYPMLSQRMGSHYGANFSLPGDGTYTARLSVGGTNVRRAGAFEGRFAEPASVEVEFPFTEAIREQVSSPPAPNAGELGAIAPMKMSALPTARAPAPGDLPGTVRGTAESGDAKLVVTTLDAPPAGIEGEGQYLAVSARTPYNGLVLPAMALSGTLTGDDETTFEGALERTLDPALGYHYGAVIGSVESGDGLTLSVGTPPQVARHKGYETAFLDMPDAELTL